MRTCVCAKSTGRVQQPAELKPLGSELRLRRMRAEGTKLNLLNKKTLGQGSGIREKEIHKCIETKKGKGRKKKRV